EEIANKLVMFAVKKIKWTTGLIQDAARGRVGIFEPSGIGLSLFRPFVKAWVYYDRLLNERVYRMPALFPAHGYSNRIIMVTGTAVSFEFSALMVDSLPDLQGPAKCQCFPLYWY